MVGTRSWPSLSFFVSGWATPRAECYYLSVSLRVPACPLVAHRSLRIAARDVRATRSGVSRPTDPRCLTGVLSAAEPPHTRTVRRQEEPGGHPWHGDEPTPGS